MTDGQYLLYCVIFMGIASTIAAAYVYHMYRVLRDDFREQVREIRHNTKIEAECRAQEMFAELLRQAKIEIKQEITLTNESNIDWGEKKDV